MRNFRSFSDAKKFERLIHKGIGRSHVPIDALAVKRSRKDKVKSRKIVSFLVFTPLVY